MKVKTVNFQNQIVGEISLNTDIFALSPRIDIIKLVVDWQRGKAMAGTHKTKTLSEVSGTTRKPYKQKGTGNARFGSLRAPQRRGGATVHGPRVRSHAIDLTKKVRKLGLKYALSSKLLEGRLFIVDSFEINSSKTSNLCKNITNFIGKSILMIGENVKNTNLELAAKNIPHIQVMSQIGTNVYDLLKYDNVLLSQEAARCLEERLL